MKGKNKKALTAMVSASHYNSVSAAGTTAVEEGVGFLLLLAAGKGINGYSYAAQQRQGK
jgi:hypothetical protein